MYFDHATAQALRPCDVCALLVKMTLDGTLCALPLDLSDTGADETGVTLDFGKCNGTITTTMRCALLVELTWHGTLCVSSKPFAMDMSPCK
jgi:hypothetical protein